MGVRSILTTLCLFSLAAPALAQAPRVVVIVGEQVDGKPASSSTVEAEVTRLLLDAGYQIVERYETASSRSEISLDKLLSGDVSGLKVSATNVDFIVVGKVDMHCECSDQPYDLGSKGKDTYKGRLDLRVITVDSGRVLSSLAYEETTPKGAVGTAKFLVERSWKELDKSLARAATSRAALELRVAGLRDVKQADALAVSLAKIPGVAGAAVRSVDADATIFDLVAPKIEVSSLTSPLSAEGLVITKRTANVITARYDETKAGRRLLAVAGFENSTGKAALDWIGDALPSVVETELTNSNYLVPVPLASRPKINPARPDSRSLGELSKAGAQVILVGSADLLSAKLRLSMRVYGADGSPLAAVQKIGDPEAVAELAQELAWELDAKLFKKLVAPSALAPYATPFARYAPPEASENTSGKSGTPAAPSRPLMTSVRGAAHLRVNDIEMENIFPARLAAYAEHPMGKLLVENPGTAPIEDVRVTVYVEGLTSAPQTFTAPKIRAGKSAEISLPLLLEREKALAIVERRPARVDISLSYVTGGSPVEESFSKSIMIEGHGAIDWRDASSIASFVTPEDPDIISFAQAALASRAAEDVPSYVPRALFTPMVLFNAISALGTRYQVDPLVPYGDSPIDRVTMPREMLQKARGDCDDLSALYASLLYAAGVRARMVTTPGHIFVAVDTGLPITSRALLEIDDDHTVVEWDGRAFIPVEITKLGSGFLAAWKDGAKELGRYTSEPSQVQTVDLESAWMSYPPFPGGSLSPSAPKLSETKLASLLSSDTSSFEPVKVGEIKDPVLALDAGVKAALRRDAETARALFESAASGKTKAGALVNLGNLEVLERDYKTAEKFYRDALKAGAKRDVAYTDLGIALYMKGDSKGAKSAFKRARSKGADQVAERFGLYKKAPKKAKKPAAKEKPATAKATPRKIKPDTTALSLGLRGADPNSIDPLEYFRWAR